MTTTVMSNFHKSFGDFDAHLMLGTTSENTEITAKITGDTTLLRQVLSALIIFPMTINFLRMVRLKNVL